MIRNAFYFGVGAFFGVIVTIKYIWLVVMAARSSRHNTKA